MRWKRFEHCQIHEYLTTGEYLGRGSFGAVFAANNRDHGAGFVGRRFAVKLFQMPDTSAEAEVIANEMRRARELVHSRLVLGFAAGKAFVTPSSDPPEPAEEFIWFQMERADGSLADQLKVRPLEWGAAVAMAKQVAEAIEFMHNSPGNSLVHCDVKPGNTLYFDTPGEPRIWKLSDFGTVREIQGTKYTSNIVGSLSYMPPEVIRLDRRALSSAWDIWSFGVTLAEALGTRPFTGDTAEGLSHAILNKRPDLPQLDSAPLALTKLLQGCLEKDRRRRWTIQQVRAALSEISDPVDVPDAFHRQTRDLAIPAGVALVSWAVSLAYLVSSR
jgi:serine/threonine protein kinase